MPIRGHTLVKEDYLRPLPSYLHLIQSFNNSSGFLAHRRGKSETERQHDF